MAIPKIEYYPEVGTNDKIVHHAEHTLDLRDERAVVTARQEKPGKFTHWCTKTQVKLKEEWQRQMGQEECLE